MLVDFKYKSQVTIPSRLVKKLNLKPGDTLEIHEENGRLIIEPVAVIPRTQAWFYSEQWQLEEQNVEKEIRSGQLKVAESEEELYTELGLD
ncbi:MAG: AbrB/MazE/SpoVT family DNA-binding domain-containing protein [Dethiobacteria bacterium]|nr:AbrB/MazE/SpoVT family DNA-binding domain-containing protein [Bacillota bacterium]MDW7729950.1 AbrB/MazE/SpoVT family DNA-binding domain-containing protein [Bacillota bacterium]